MSPAVRDRGWSRSHTRTIDAPHGEIVACTIAE